MIEGDPVLGDFVALHPSARLRLLLPVAVIGALIALALGVVAALYDTWWSPFVTIGGTALTALIAGWWLLHHWNREVIVYRHGFTVREGSRVIPITYAEVRALRVTAEQLAYLGGLLRRAVYRIHITTNRDETMVLTNIYSRIDALSLALEAGVKAALGPQIRYHLRGGETVAFGPHLGVSEAGLHSDRDSLAWADFAGYTVAQRALHLQTTAGDTWRAVPLAEIDNLMLLVDLLRDPAAITRDDG